MSNDFKPMTREERDALLARVEKARKWQGVAWRKEWWDFVNKDIPALVLTAETAETELEQLKEADRTDMDHVKLIDEHWLLLGESLESVCADDPLTCWCPRVTYDTNTNQSIEVVSRFAGNCLPCRLRKCLFGVSIKQSY